MPCKGQCQDRALAGPIYTACCQELTALAVSPGTTKELVTALRIGQGLSGGVYINMCAFAEWDFTVVQTAQG